MKKILVPCNFSTCCDNAVAFAVELAAISSGEVIILTILNLPEITSDAKEFDKQRKEAHAGFDRIKKDYPMTNLRHVVSTGKKLPAILEYINRGNIDLVVMGTKGSRGWQQIFMGSNAEKVVRTSPVPVFSIKGPTAVRSIKNIVLPCDLRHCESAFVEKVKGLQQHFRARLHLLHVNTNAGKEDSSLIPRLKAYATQHGLDQVTLNVRLGHDEREEIIHFAKEIHADMIAMQTHGNLDMEHLFAASIAADVVNHAPLPTWTCAVSTKTKLSRIDQPA